MKPFVLNKTFVFRIKEGLKDIKGSEVMQSAEVTISPSGMKDVPSKLLS